MTARAKWRLTRSRRQLSIPWRQVPFETLRPRWLVADLGFTLEALAGKPARIS
jgi:hypothetical protein